MKKFTKLFLSCAAVAAVTAAVATSAMAADKDLTASYETDATTGLGKVTITCASEDATKTLLILKPGATRTDVKTTDILQIDQKDGAITEAVIPALDKTKDEDRGTYTVLVGGTSGDIYVGTFSIGGTEITLGNVDFSADGITPTDASLILQQAVGKGVLDSNKLAIAAANVDKSADGVTPTDASLVLQKAVGKDVVGPGEVVTVDDNGNILE